jgi:hypothetical protein
MEQRDPGILAQIREGMDVHDREGHKIGKVDYVQLSSENPTSAEPDTVTTDQPGETMADSLIENLAEALTGTDEIPEQIRNHLLRMGFIRVDTGMLRKDRFATDDQIASVAGEHVHLSISGDDLIAL